MQLSQKVRRWFYRARRAMFGSGADHEPIVEVEGAARRVQSPVRYALAHWARSGIAFIATLFVLGVLYGVSVAWRERVSLPPDLTESATGPASGSHAIAAAAALLSLDSADSQRNAWFAPLARKARLAAFQDGAAEAVAAFVEVVERRRRGQDKDLALAASELAQEGPAPAAHYAAARDALRRFNVRAGHGGPPVDRGQRAMAALARAASASAAAHDHALHVFSDEPSPGAINGDARAEFYRARGQAYAWRALLGAYEEDLPPERRTQLAQPLAAARAGLASPAAFEPLVLATPLIGKKTPLTSLAERIAASDGPLQTLAAAADTAPPVGALAGPGRD